MKKSIALSFLCLVLLTGFAMRAEAHVLQVDGSIGAVLHIDPDDDPIANAPATFFFDFKDTQNQFQIPDCNCTVTVSSNGKTLFSENLNNTADVKTASTSASFSYTFPAEGIYAVVAQGAPVSGKQFQSFTLTYDIRVDREAAAGAQPSWLSQLLGEHAIHIVIFAVAIVIGIFLTIRGDKKEKLL
jgi:hypothetical protein